MTEHDEQIKKHLKNLKDGYHNRLVQLLQMQEQMEEQIKGATDNMELLLQEVELVKQNLSEVDELIGPEDEEELLLAIVAAFAAAAGFVAVSFSVSGFLFPPAVVAKVRVAALLLLVIFILFGRKRLLQLQEERRDPAGDTGGHHQGPGQGGVPDRVRRSSGLRLLHDDQLLWSGRPVVLGHLHRAALPVVARWRQPHLRQF